MSRPLVAMLVSISFGAACQGAELASSSGDVEFLLAYIDPGVAGFVIVSILGFISSVGYLARSYLARMKRRLFGHGEADAENRDDGAGVKDTEDGEAANC